MNIGKVGHIPNWIKENDWKAESRLEWISTIMALSPRDWSITHNIGDMPSHYDAEKWAIWCLACCDTKNEALKTWCDFCEQYSKRLPDWCPLENTVEAQHQTNPTP